MRRKAYTLYKIKAANGAVHYTLWKNEAEEWARLLNVPLYVRHDVSIACIRANGISQVEGGA